MKTFHLTSLNKTKGIFLTRIPNQYKNYVVLLPEIKKKNKIDMNLMNF